MRVLVTGASGFVGGAVARDLLAHGHAVVGLVRDPGRAAALAGAGAQLRRGDMLSPETYVPLVAEVDAVVHAAQYATSGRFTRGAAARIRHADHVMTDALAVACAAGGKRLVYTSGCFNYGDHGDDWITEDTPFTPSPLGEGHAGEVLALRERRARDGLDVVVLAPGFVYGPGGLFQSSFVDQLQANRLRVIGSGQNFWSPVHRDDLATAYLAAVTTAPAGGEYNITDGHPLRLRELVDQLTDAMGHKRVGTIPPILLKPLLGGPLVDSLTTSFRIGNDRARVELGWRPRYPSFADGLPDTLAALDHHHPR